MHAAFTKIVEALNSWVPSASYLARKAAILMLRLVSGVTISVFEKSMDPSPGCGMG